MFREVEISGLGAVCAVVLIFSCMAMMLAGLASKSSIDLDHTRLRRLSVASKHLAHFAGEALRV
jgi:hypothetical protein